MKPIERLAWYLREHKIKLNTVERRSGLGIGYLSKQINNQASIGSDILEKICHAFPELNAAWLLTGKGSYLNTVPGMPVTNEPVDKLELIEGLGITDREKYELCRLFAQKLLLQITLLEKELSVLRSRASQND